jgi:hypothetical protein
MLMLTARWSDRLDVARFLVSSLGFIDYFPDNNNYYKILKEQKVI